MPCNGIVTGCTHIDWIIYEHWTFNKMEKKQRQKQTFLSHHARARNKNHRIRNHQIFHFDWMNVQSALLDNTPHHHGEFSASLFFSWGIFRIWPCFELRIELTLKCYIKWYDMRRRRCSRSNSVIHCVYMYGVWIRCVRAVGGRLRIQFAMDSFTCMR